MSLEASVHSVRQFIKTFEGIVEIGDALETALAAKQMADAADKRVAKALEEQAKALEVKNQSIALGEVVKQEAAEILAKAKSDAAAIRTEAKAKADATVLKAKEKAGAQAEAHATAAEIFASQKQANDEILAMTGAQIAHAEAKLSEIRQAIAKITGVQHA